MFAIIQKRNILFAVSLALLIPGIVAVSVWGLNLGIDFRGGSLLGGTVDGTPPDSAQLLAIVHDVVPGEVTAQLTGDRGFVLRLPALDEPVHQQLVEKLQANLTGFREESFESIGPTIGKELRQKAYLAIVLVFIGIIVYITWAFRTVSRGPVTSWVYGLSAFIAMFHDLLLVVGIFAILGHFFEVQIDNLFVTALLTVLGFSVHDTIVVFDRIRERLTTHRDDSFEFAVNASLNQTLVRSLNTSLTTLIVLVALLLFGGRSVQNFVLALTIGIASGTYSSIFVASPLLVVWERWRARH